MEEALGAARDPDALERVDPDALRDLAGDDAIDDLEQLQELTRALTDAGYLDRDGGRLEPTPRAARKLGMRALTDIFSRLRREGFGGHAIPAAAAAASRPTRPSATSSATRSRSTSTAPSSTRWPAGRRHAGASWPRRLRGPRPEETTVSSTVLLLDMSRRCCCVAAHRPPRRWRWRSHTLIHTKYPRDRLVRGRVRLLRPPAEAGVDSDPVAVRVRVRNEPAARADHRPPAARPIPRRQQGDRGHHRWRADRPHRQRPGRVRLSADAAHGPVHVARGGPMHPRGDRHQHLHARAIARTCPSSWT